MNNDLAHKYDGHKNKKCLNKAINSFHHMELIYDNSCSFNCKEIALFSLVLQKEIRRNSIKKLDSVKIENSS